MGNIYGRLQGSSRGVVMSGSHCDAIPLSGKYDGTVGVLGAIMAIKAIRLSVCRNAISGLQTCHLVVMP
jgi:ureidoglycolate amidohydrolase